MGFHEHGGFRGMGSSSNGVDSIRKSREIIAMAAK